MVSKNQKRDIKNYGEGFRHNVENVKTQYETYKRKEDASSSTRQKQLDRGSEEAYNRVSQANREADNEEKRERNRAEQAASGNGRPDYSKKWTE